MAVLCVFDIDDTLLRIVETYQKHWFEMGWVPRSVVPTGADIETQNTVMHVELQAGIDDLFAYLKASTFYRTALWTLGSSPYAHYVAAFLTRRYTLPSDFFLFTWSADEVVDVAMSKDLRQVYAAFPAYGQHNTVLIDDNPDNIYHAANEHNGICMPPFENKYTLYRILRCLKALQEVYLEHDWDDAWMALPLLYPSKQSLVLERMDQIGRELRSTV